MSREMARERMKTALAYLRDYEARRSKPTVLMFNEMEWADLALIQGQNWVQDDYHITDLRGEKWSHTYGEAICCISTGSLLTT